MPPRFFCDLLPGATTPGLSDGASTPAAVGALVTLGADEARHARKVLRLEPGSSVELFDGSGTLALATLEGYDRHAARCRVTDVEHAAPPRPTLTLACAVPKGTRADAMVNDLAQLGVDRFVPLRTARSVVDPRDHKLDRLERAAVAAAKQSGRLTVMRIEPTRTLDDVLAETTRAPDSDAHVTLLLDPRQGAEAEAVHARLRCADHVTLLVGPEGGWSGEELAACGSVGVTRWRVNSNVLRIETAAAAAAALVRYVTMGR